MINLCFLSSRLPTASPCSLPFSLYISFFLSFDCCLTLSHSPAFLFLTYFCLLNVLPPCHPPILLIFPSLPLYLLVFPAFLPVVSFLLWAFPTSLLFPSLPFSLLSSVFVSSPAFPFFIYFLLFPNLFLHFSVRSVGHLILLTTQSHKPYMVSTLD